METQRDLAIILRSVRFEERHRMVTALTENHGRVTALARNSIQSRRFGGTLDPFTASEWRFTEKAGRAILTLEGAEIRRSFEGLRSDFQRLSMAGVFSELILKVAPESEACPDLFKLHSNALACLEELPAGDSAGELALLNGYLAKILQWSGSQPQLGHCLECGQALESVEPHVALNCLVADAGWICCSSRRDTGGFQHLFRRVTPAALLDFHTALTLPIRQIPATRQASREEHVGLSSFLQSLVAYHIPGFDQNEPLKSMRFVQTTSAPSIR